LATLWPDNVTPLVSAVSPPPQAAVKFLPVALGPTVTLSVAGVKVQPLLDGVTVYVPAARPARV